MFPASSLSSAAIRPDTEVLMILEISETPGAIPTSRQRLCPEKKCLSNQAIDQALPGGHQDSG